MVDKKQQEVIYGKNQLIINNMRRLAGIVESPIAPPTNMVWLNKNIFRYFSNGQWTEIGGNAVAFQNPEGQAIINTPVIKLSNTTADKNNNIEV